MLNSTFNLFLFLPTKISLLMQKMLPEVGGLALCFAHPQLMGDPKMLGSQGSGCSLMMLELHPLGISPAAKYTPTPG